MSAAWIDSLSSSDSRLHKEEVLGKILNMAILGDQEAERFLQFAQMAYNPFITFGVRQVPTTEGLTDQSNPWVEFIVLLNYLQQRVYTGNTARDEIAKLSQKFDSEEWNKMCRPTMIKDLRCGISEKTINKVVGKSKWKIPVFGCQLATSCEDRPEMSGVKRLEPKLDGVRALAFVNSVGNVTIFSRNGKQFENFEHIEAEISENWERLRRGHQNYLTNGFVLDGEIIGKSFQALMKQARRKENVEASDSVFTVFDIIPTEDFVRGHWNDQLEKRVKILDNLRHVFDDMPHVELISNIVVDLDTGEGRDQFRRYCNDVVEQGFEGVMIKNLEAPYECKRSTRWLKWKPVITVDLEVIDVEEGTGRNQGRLGALVCSGIDSERKITVNVGSGFSDGDRDSFWSDRSMVIGRTVEILCDVVTRNQDGTYSLRFPRFVRFRDMLTGVKE